MKPNKYDYLKAVGSFFGGLLAMAAVVLVLVLVVSAMLTFEAFAAVVGILGLAAIVFWVVGGIIKAMAEQSAKDRHFESTVQTNLGRLSFEEMLDQIDDIYQISVEELKHFTDTELSVLMKALECSVRVYPRQFSVEYWESWYEIVWDDTYLYLSDVKALLDNMMEM